MINKDLLDYIRANTNSGKDFETIKKELMTGGWSADDIAEGFHAINATNPLTKTNSTSTSPNTPASSGLATPSTAPAELVQVVDTPRTSPEPAPVVAKIPLSETGPTTNPEPSQTSPATNQANVPQTATPSSPTISLGFASTSMPKSSEHDPIALYRSMGSNLPSQKKKSRWLRWTVITILILFSVYLYLYKFGLPKFLN